MKITIIREDENSGKKALSTCEADAFCERIKTETKAGYVSGLREVLPRMDGTDARYVHIGRLPCVYPAAEYARTRDGGHRMKHYNGLVQLEVNRLSGLSETEFVKRMAALLPRPSPHSAVPADGA